MQLTGIYTYNSGYLYSENAETERESGGLKMEALYGREKRRGEYEAENFGAQKDDKYKEK